MARKVEEWIGEHDDQEIPARVKLRIILRSKGRCVQCQRKFDAKLKPQMDHRPALINGGEHRESKIFATCAACHSAFTKLDRKEKTQRESGERKRYGLDKPKSRPMPGSKASGWRKLMSGAVVRRTSGD